MIVFAVSLLLQGCCFRTLVETSPLLVVEEQHTEVQANKSNNYACEAQFTIDVPVKGPRVLVDSVMAFLNKELYHAFENGLDLGIGKVKFDQKKIVSNDAENLLSHYRDIYEPLLKEELDYTLSFTLKMEAQTESFVTYG